MPVLEAATRNPVQHVRDDVIFYWSQKVIKQRMKVVGFVVYVLLSVV